MRQDESDRLLTYTIVSKPESIEAAFGISGLDEYVPKFRVSRGDRVPILIHCSGRAFFCLATYGISKQNRSVAMESVLTKRPFNRWIRRSRCVIPLNCHFAMKHDRTHLVRVLNHRIMGAGGVFVQEQGDLCFEFLTTENTDVMNDFQTRMPVWMNKEKALQWLTAQSLADIMAIADAAGDYWFDFFEVGTSVLVAGELTREDLIPKGLSRSEQMSRMHAAEKLKFESERKSRRSLKR